MKDYEILGIDIGNALIKSSSGIVFESKITTIEPLNATDSVTINGVTYYLRHGDYDTTYRKVDKKYYMPMLLSSIALSSDKPVCLILGLPLSQYREDKARLTNMVMQNGSTSIALNGVTKNINIIDVDVFPEGVVTLEDSFQGIVVDIGGRTTDCALITNIRDVRKINNPLSLPYGTINLYGDIIKTLNKEFSLDLNLGDAERIMTAGLYLDGKKQSIDFLEEIFKNFAEKIVNSLRVEYSTRTNLINLTGGGSSILYKYIKKILGEGVMLQENPIMANANAYYELGCELWQ